MRDGSASWAWWLLAAAVGVHLFMMGSLFWGYLDALFDNSHSLAKGVDFFSIYEGGRNALENRPLYHFDATDTSATPDHNPYRYLPSLAYVVAVPLNALPAWSAYWLWVSVNEVLLVLNAFLTWRVGRCTTWAVVAAAMWFVFTPFYVEMYVGQFSFLMATLLLVAGIGLAQARELPGGVAWAVSVVSKSSSALLAPVVARARWWRSIALAAGLLLANGLYYLARPRDFEYFLWLNFHQIFDVGLLDFQPRAGDLRYFVDPDQRFLQFSAGEHGLLALFRNSYLALDSTATDLPGGISIVIVVLVLGISLTATFLPRRPDFVALFAIWTAAFFLTYTAWEHHYVMLLPALALLVALRPAHRPIVLATFIIVALPTPYWLINLATDTSLPPANALVTVQESWPAWAVVLHHAVKPIPVLVLWTVLVAGQVGHRFGTDDGVKNSADRIS